MIRRRAPRVSGLPEQRLAEVPASEAVTNDTSVNEHRVNEDERHVAFFDLDKIESLGHSLYPKGGHRAFDSGRAFLYPRGKFRTWASTGFSASASEARGARNTSNASDSTGMSRLNEENFTFEGTIASGEPTCKWASISQRFLALCCRARVTRYLPVALSQGC